jgi:hypothetical protein
MRFGHPGQKRMRVLDERFDFHEMRCGVVLRQKLIPQRTLAPAGEDVFQTFDDSA